MSTSSGSIPPATDRPELHPLTPSVYLHDREEAFSPELLQMCLQRPIMLVRNLAQACNMDLSLYSTKTLLASHPSHPVEIRHQLEQSPEENWDPTMSEQVWYCTSSHGHSTIAGYAEYQGRSFEETLSATGSEEAVNPPLDFAERNTRRTIKFGTNCDLSDEKKWAPQLKELCKLPHWARVKSPGNMLSHIGHQILGMNTVQLYMKVPCARTPGHQENNNFCAVNVNVGPGDTEWFAVAAEHWSAVERLCAGNGVDFLKTSWWPNLADLIAAGIPVYRFLQKPGDLVWVNTGCVHWVQARGYCNNIAWNVGPLSHAQYAAAMERYEWNKTRGFQSIVAMTKLSWNLARNLRFLDPCFNNALRITLLKSLQSMRQDQAFAKDNEVQLVFYGCARSQNASFCEDCKEEVFNLLFVKKRERVPKVYCRSCIVKLCPNLKTIACFQEYDMNDLYEVYRAFRAQSPGLH